LPYLADKKKEIHTSQRLIVPRGTSEEKETDKTTLFHVEQSSNKERK